MALKRVYHALENQDNYRAMPDAAGGTRERVLRLFGGLQKTEMLCMKIICACWLNLQLLDVARHPTSEVAQFYNSSFAVRIGDSAENALLVTAGPKWATRTSVLTETVIHLSPKMTAQPPS